MAQDQIKLLVYRLEILRCKQALLGAAFESLFISHPDKPEVLRIFKEQSEKQFQNYMETGAAPESAVKQTRELRDKLLDGMREEISKSKT